MTGAMRPPTGDDAAALPLLLEAAVAFAREAGEITLRHFGGVLAADSKADGTPVTRADREAETYLRARILTLYPDHSVLGEEFGAHEGPAPVRWIIDPIDGTRAFMRGVPLYAVLIGIEIGGAPLVGVAHFPALDETVAAARGRGCRWWQGSGRAPVQAKVSGVQSLGESLALTTDLERVLVSDIGMGWRALAG